MRRYLEVWWLFALMGADAAFVAIAVMRRDWFVAVAGVALVVMILVLLRLATDDLMEDQP